MLHLFKISSSYRQYVSRSIMFWALRISAYPWNPVLCVLWKYRSCRNRRPTWEPVPVAIVTVESSSANASIFPEISE